MKIRRRREIAVSEAELTALTADLADAHHDTLPGMLAAANEMGASRRSFLLGAGALLGGVAIAGTGLGSGLGSGLGLGGGSGSAGASTFAAKSGLTGDLAIVALAASLENLAVATYQAGIDAATAGKLGTVPPAVVTFAQTAQSQHRDHAAAWNGVLTGAGKQEVTGVDLTVKKSVDQAFGMVTDVPGLAKLALDLEEGAAATYLAAISAVKSPAGLATAASIHPVELQHAAILHFLLGEYPVPDAFATTKGARTTSDKIG
jgi:hypothetical protein